METKQTKIIFCLFSKIHFLKASKLITSIVSDNEPLKISVPWLLTIENTKKQKGKFSASVSMDKIFRVDCTYRLTKKDASTELT